MPKLRFRFIRAAFGLLIIAAVALKAASQPVTPSARRDESRDETSGAKFVGKKTETAIAAGLAYLAANQHDDGSFGSGHYRGNVAVTALSGMSFLAAGYTPGRGRYGNVVSRTLNYILSRAQPNGYIVDSEVRYHGPMYGHGFATLFLAETYGMTGNKTVRKNLRQKLKRAVELIEKTQNRFTVNLNGKKKTAGGWRYEPESEEADISVTVCQVMALRAARNCGIAVSKTIIDRSVVYVKACQNRNGGFRYQTILQSPSIFPRSAAALVALYSAGIYQGREIDAGLAYLKRLRPDGGKPRKDNHYFYGHYYAVQAMWHAGGDHWKRWFPAIRDELLTDQKTNGHWEDTYVCDAYGTAMSCLILQTPLNYLPIFQR